MPPRRAAFPRKQRRRDGKNLSSEQVRPLPQYEVRCWLAEWPGRIREFFWRRCCASGRRNCIIQQSKFRLEPILDHSSEPVEIPMRPALLRFVLHFRASVLFSSGCKGRKGRKDEGTRILRRAGYFEGSEVRHSSAWRTGKKSRQRATAREVRRPLLPSGPGGVDQPPIHSPWRKSNYAKQLYDYNPKTFFAQK